MWASDNAIFNVNGLGLEKLRNTIRLAIGNETMMGYRVSEKKGLIFIDTIFSSDNISIKFPVPLPADLLAEMAFEWLKSPAAQKVTCEGWDADADHDGDNEMGWRVYTEDWGHVDGENAIAVKPAYMWYGK